MSSPLDIANQALGHLGTGKQIDDFNEKSYAAEQCRLYFDPARRRTLRQFDWPFARAFGPLVAMDGVTPLRPFTNVYKMPVCVAFREIERDPMRPFDRIPFKRTSADDGGELIHTDVASASGIWTKDVEDPEQRDEGFAYVMGWALAVDLAMPITKSQATFARMGEMFMRQKSNAETDAANAEPQKMPAHDDVRQSVSWLDARGD